MKLSKRGQVFEGHNTIQYYILRPRNHLNRPVVTRSSITHFTPEAEAEANTRGKESAGIKFLVAKSIRVSTIERPAQTYDFLPG